MRRSRRARHRDSQLTQNVNRNRPSSERTRAVAISGAGGQSERMTRHSDPHGVTAIYGGAGTGKTTLIVGALVAYGRLGATLSLDVTGDIERALKKRLPKTQRIYRVSSAKEYTALTKDSFIHGRFDGFARGTHLIVVLPPSDKRGANSLDDAIGLWLALASDPRHRARFVVAFCDEAEQVFPSTGRIDPAFRESVLVARNESRSIVLAVKRPTALAPSARSAVRRLCVFRVNADADVRACAELGPASLFVGVQYLARGRYLYYDSAEHTPASELPECDSLDAPPWV